jgi:hypothetical protein
VDWVVFIYSLPSGQPSSSRVSIWRRLQRLGAISPRAGVHVLPAQEEALEALQWLAQEVQQSNGDPLIIKVGEFEGLTDHELIELFRKQSEDEYKELEIQGKALDSQCLKGLAAEDRLRLRVEVQKLRRKHTEVCRTDFFDAASGPRVGALLARIEKAVIADEQQVPQIKKLSTKDFRGKTWVTRPRPHVDRLACAWLIRRFIDDSALIRYATAPSEGEVGFDFKSGGVFGHVGNLCTFEAIMRSFDLNGAPLQVIADIVHEIDIRDGVRWHPEIAGVDAILKGWLLAHMTDSQLETHGIALFEGLYQELSMKAQSGKSRKTKVHG